MYIIYGYIYIILKCIFAITFIHVSVSSIHYPTGIYSMIRESKVQRLVLIFQPRNPYMMPMMNPYMMPNVMPGMPGATLPSTVPPTVAMPNMTAVMEIQNLGENSAR